MSTHGEVIKMYGRYYSDNNSLTYRIPVRSLQESAKTRQQLTFETSISREIRRQHDPESYENMAINEEYNSKVSSLRRRLDSVSSREYVLQELARYKDEYVRIQEVNKTSPNQEIGRESKLLKKINRLEEDLRDIEQEELKKPSIRKQLDEMIQIHEQEELVAKEKFEEDIQHEISHSVVVYKYDDSIISFSFILPDTSTYNSDNKYVYILYYPSEKLAFTVSRFVQSGDRKHAIVYCYNNKSGLEYSITQHTYYTSVSDGSFWRYCVHNGAGIYEKGFNYVSTTMINMNLQTYIDFIIPNYNIFDKLENGTVARPTTCPTVEECGVNFTRRLNEQFCGDGQTLTGEQLVCVRNEVFRVFDDVFKYQIRDERPYSSGAELTIYNDFERILRLLKKPHTDDALAPYYAELLKHYNRVIGGYMPRDISSLDDAIKNRSIYKKVYTVMEQMFNNHFRHREDLGTILHEKDRVTNIEDYKLILDTYSVFYEDVNLCIYQLYYVQFGAYFNGMKLKIIDGSPQIIPDDGNKDFKAILHIIPYGINNGNKIIRINHVSPFGMDNTYVSAGTFVSKLFDYTDRTQTGDLKMSDPIKVYIRKNSSTYYASTLKKFIESNIDKRHYTPLFDIIDAQWLPN